jgi:DNA-binding PadR family transcriptional regulator
MPRPNRTRYTVLGVLTLRPMSGYDIKKFIEGSIANFWRESFGQLYPTLRELAEEALVTRRVEEQEGKPDRYVYRITPEGRQELQEWLTDPAESEVPRSELLLKLFFGAEVSTEASLRHVQRRREELEANLAVLGAIQEQLQSEKRTAPGLPYWLLTIRQGVLVDEALLKWCDEVEVVLRRRKGRSARARQLGQAG